MPINRLNSLGYDNVGRHVAAALGAIAPGDPSGYKIVGAA